MHADRYSTGRRGRLVHMRYRAAALTARAGRRCKANGGFRYTPAARDRGTSGWRPMTGLPPLFFQSVGFSPPITGQLGRTPSWTAASPSGRHAAGYRKSLSARVYVTPSLGKPGSFHRHRRIHGLGHLPEHAQSRAHVFHLLDSQRQLLGFLIEAAMLAVLLYEMQHTPEAVALVKP